jgi:hypothetical protein
MVVVKPAKQPKKVKAVKAKVVKTSSSQIAHPLSGSPSTKSNTATVRNGESILNADEQKSYKLWISEIKQIQGLVICQCGLLIQTQSCCTQTAQEALFVRDFPINYEKFCRHPILGARVKNVPFIYLTVGTSTATEILNGEKLRKKYSSMKTYINNTLTPIYNR